MAGTNGIDPREQERRRVARIMQEKAENEREIMEALHRWDMRMVANESCAIFPGDYVAVGSCCICSSRGVQVDMDAGDIAEMIGIGGLSQVFDMDDLNAPDMDDRIDAIMKEVARQREFRDAKCYCHEPSLHKAVAVYSAPGLDGAGADAPTAAVERNGASFSFRVGFDAGDVPSRQCSYEEFNPGGADIIAALRDDAKPEQGKNADGAYARLLAHYEATGGGVPEKPSDAVRRIPGYDQMTPSEQLAAQVSLADEYHQSLERSRAQEQAPDASDQWGPRLPGQRRMDV